MDLKSARNASHIVYQWLSRSEDVKSVVEEPVRRPPYPCHAPAGFPCASPESQGISSDHILKYFNRLAREKSIRMQSVTVVRNGYTLARAKFYPYDTDIWHVSHSMCKSLVGLGIGLLYDDGMIDLDARIVDVMRDVVTTAGWLNHRTTTVRHLLTMTSGVWFNEIGSVTETDWVRAFFDSATKFKPGTNFEYNSMNTYMLSAMIKKISGRGVFDLLDERIFKPLGIKNIFWEKCPKGIEKGGWGLYFYPDDMLKIGQLYLNGGVWHGERLISSQWIRYSTERQVKTPDATGPNDYGYQIWVRDDASEFLFNGMFGQNLIVFPKINLMLLTTAGTEEVFQASEIYRITDRYFGGNFRPDADMKEDPEAYKRLTSAQSKLAMKGSDAEKVLLHPGPPDEELEAKFTGEYEIDKKDGVGISVMPELYQGIHNNFAEGLSGMDLKIKDGEGELCTHEGTHVFRIRFGFSEAIPGCINYGGEAILTSAYAVITEKGDLRITVCFPELPNTRIITMHPNGEDIETTWEETPGYEFLNSLLVSTVLEGANPALIETLKGISAAGFVEKRLKYFLKPTITAKRKKGS